MKIFRLPDLGEGLPEAIIREWYVKPGDEVQIDQTIVAMETAKALVDVPAPFSGKVEKLFGQPGDTIETGKPLIGVEGEEDSGTVVGSIEQSDTVLHENATGVTVQQHTAALRATPAVRMLAQQLGVNLEEISVSGNVITADDVKRATNLFQQNTPQPLNVQFTDAVESLSPTRRAMVMSMTQSHQHIVPVSISDDADIHDWAGKQDVTVRLLRAVQAGCEAVPITNAYFDAQQMVYQLHKEINVGMAVDTEHGLFVPVLKNIAQQSNEELRETINRFKQQSRDKTLPARDLKGATIMLSNFGTIAGRYANPIIVPPMVAIVGIGKAREKVVAHRSAPAVRRILPISITVDHRLVTGGEAIRLLHAIMEALAKP
ncbi:MAG: 2-oxo acid dehydrogenase subunit E2 [Gammaproteobacteria bacterium]|nr:2-oxo acid dehydrogenase subunit E2 [Gammaproteobacteria bacterium]MCD8542853.1 2-oxo acid dehydrogenase subunit E2 [Gammaproteobacteria bacterium]